MQTTRFLTAFWALARPYWVSEQRRKGQALLATVLVLSLAQVWINLRINYWFNDFYSALQDKRLQDFYGLLAAFTALSLAYIGCGVYAIYLRQMLQIEWRTWLNERFLERWLDERAYYRLQLADRGIDNPDQRIAEDLNLFVGESLVLGLGLLSALATLLSFGVVLWTLSGTFEIAGVGVPGYMLWFAALYAIAGSVAAHWIGKPLVALEFNHQRFEADYRFSLVRLREESEGVALYRGEREELGNFAARFANVVGNWWGIMRKRKQLNFFTFSYGQIAVAFPYLLAAPRYFSGALQLGGLVQTASAFSQVHRSLSWFIEAYPQFAQWKATVDRLTSFSASLAEARAKARSAQGERAQAPEREIALDALELALPQGKPLLATTTLKLRPGEHVLIAGPTGAGKSTFFRALAGIWPYWNGRVRLPQGARLMFLPQKPYLPIGTLKRAVAYPGDPARHEDSEIADVLNAVGLPRLAPDLERSENWAQVLSGGEQQRLAFARALLNKPDWLFLDEATASLPEDAQDALYRLLKQELPGTTLVSIGHRKTLRGHHARQLAWQGERLVAVA